jgi:hypothetical protein
VTDSATSALLEDDEQEEDQGDLLLENHPKLLTLNSEK